MIMHYLYEDRDRLIATKTLGVQCGDLCAWCNRCIFHDVPNPCDASSHVHYVGVTLADLPQWMADHGYEENPFT